jgi:hypothetical protein
VTYGSRRGAGRRRRKRWSLGVHLPAVFAVRPLSASEQTRRNNAVSVNTVGPSSETNVVYWAVSLRSVLDVSVSAGGLLRAQPMSRLAPTTASMVRLGLRRRFI